MAKILSPTRGGEPSYLNQDRAITIAKERKAKLIFLYISDVQFNHQVADPILEDVAAELEEIGEFLLSMAQERAAEAGLEVEAIVKSGHFREVLEMAIKELAVDTIILGSSQEDSSLTTTDYLRDLSTELAKNFSVEVILLRGGEILENIRPS